MTEQPTNSVPERLGVRLAKTAVIAVASLATIALVCFGTPEEQSRHTSAAASRPRNTPPALTHPPTSQRHLTLPERNTLETVRSAMFSSQSWQPPPLLDASQRPIDPAP